MTVIILSYHHGDVDDTNHIALTQTTPTGVWVEVVVLRLSVRELAFVSILTEVLELNFTAFMSNNTHFSAARSAVANPYCFSYKTITERVSL